MGEKLNIRWPDLTDHIAVKIEQAEWDQDQLALIGKRFSQGYRVMIADDRLDVLADDFMEYSSIRKETGKSELVFIDRMKSTQMAQCIDPRWSKPRQYFIYISAELS